MQPQLSSGSECTKGTQVNGCGSLPEKKLQIFTGNVANRLAYLQNFMAAIMWSNREYTTAICTITTSSSVRYDLIPIYAIQCMLGQRVCIDTSYIIVLAQQYRGAFMRQRTQSTLFDMIVTCSESRPYLNQCPGILTEIPMKELSKIFHSTCV